MPASNVRMPLPLTRLNPWYPGQMGVEGGWTETGLRQHCTGTVFYVDPNFPGADDGRDGTDPTSPLATVQAAVSKCADHAGDVILVMANGGWQYDKGTVSPLYIQEEVVLNKAGVHLIGVSQGGLGVLWTPASNGGTCLTVTGIDCTVEGFVFSEGLWTGCNGIYAEWDGVIAFGENLTIRNCVFDDTVDIAIQLEYAWYNLIEHNVFSECDTAGIYVDPAGSGSAYNIIRDNIFQDCAAALSVQGMDDSHIHGNSIYNANAQGAGVATDEGIDTTGGANNQVFDNFFSCLLPVPANGDWDDLNTAAATDAWVGNHCMNGLAVTNPT